MIIYCLRIVPISLNLSRISLITSALMFGLSCTKYTWLELNWDSHPDGWHWNEFEYVQGIMPYIWYSNFYKSYSKGNIVIRQIRKNVRNMKGMENDITS